LHEEVHRFVGLEAGRRDGYTIGPRLEVNDAEISRIIGRGDLFRVGGVFKDGYLRAAHDSARSIDYCTSHGTVDGCLSTGDRDNETAEQGQKGEDT
jgi:hypothetical protein